jgi:hypothetical protein
MKILWERQQADFPHTSNVIAAGLDKLEQYYAQTNLTLAYQLATSMSHVLLSYYST